MCVLYSCVCVCVVCVFFFQAEDGIRDLVRSRGLGDVYKRQQLQDEGLRAEAVDHRLDGEVEVRAQLVHLVDEADPRDAIFVGLAPHRLGLRLDTFLGVEHRARAVQDTQLSLIHI